MWTIIAAVALLGWEPTLPPAEMPAASAPAPTASSDPNIVAFQSAVEWFRNGVALPVLQASSLSEARRALEERATEANQARDLMLQRIWPLLVQHQAEISEATSDWAADLPDKLGDRLDEAQIELLLQSVLYATAGVVSHFAFMGRFGNVAPATDIRQDVPRLHQLAARADVLLLIIAMATEPDAPLSRSDILTGLLLDAREASLAHHHALLAFHDSWRPGWRDEFVPQELELSSAELADVAEALAGRRQA
jgi:hypothetical protein